MLIKLGILGGKADCWYFWTLAGLTPQDVTQVLPKRKTGLVKQTDQNSGLVIAGPGKTLNSKLVPVPLLPLHAAACKEKGSSAYELEEAMPENVLAAPSVWCPNPSDTISLRVKGDSMEPLLQDGYLLVIDRKQNNLATLEGEMLVAHHNNFGLVVSRFFKIDGHRMLVPDNRTHEPVHFNAGWRVTGKVLWWLGLPRVTRALKPLG
jgi:hypothetical protein